MIHSTPLLASGTGLTEVILSGTNGLATSANYLELRLEAGAANVGVVRLTGWASYDPYADSSVTNYATSAVPGIAGNPAIVYLPTGLAVSSVHVDTDQNWYLTYGFVIPSNPQGLILTAGGQNL